MIKFLVILASLSSFHPVSEIKCLKYMPGSDVEVPAGIVFQYTPAQWRDNQMRCYCEIVKQMERLCIRAGYSSARCKAKTNTWVQRNFPISPVNNGSDNERDGRANFILNIRPTY